MVVIQSILHLTKKHTLRKCFKIYRNWNYQQCQLLYTSYVDQTSTPNISDKKSNIHTISKENRTDVEEVEKVSKIRNFCIIAHIDHGKSTLADRILEMCGAISKKKENKQVLDKLQVERERGITVKAQTATVIHKYNGEDYILNLIDTPGHVDFSYEVSRSLSACQGVILLIDASQGIQAQTMANFYLAFARDLIIIPVLNKIDLKTADVPSTISQIVNILEMSEEDTLKISAKVGEGVADVLDAIVTKIPPPSGDSSANFRALIFDSWFEHFRGVIINVAVVDGRISMGDTIIAAHSKKSYEIKELGILAPDLKPKKSLECGEVGYIIPGMKTSKEAQIGDTVHKPDQEVDVFPGFKPAKPVVFAGIYPCNLSDYHFLKEAISKLTLNDSSVSISNESSTALGQGFRLGFLGLLHMEVFTQRLDQEHNINVVVTTPHVPYKVRIGGKNVKKSQIQEFLVTNPSELPPKTYATEFFEPMVLGTIILPQEYLGDVMQLCMLSRGVHKDSVNIDEKRIMMRYNFPLNEVIVDFFDELKRLTSGYASFDYEDAGFESSDICKLEFKLNGQYVDELATVVHCSKAREMGQRICERLKEVIPQHQFKVQIQASVMGKIVAREDLAALKKNVLAKCYGGDVTRKMKLLKFQAIGKKRMRAIGKVEVPTDAFLKILKR